MRARIARMDDLRYPDRQVRLRLRPVTRTASRLDSMDRGCAGALRRPSSACPMRSSTRPTVPSGWTRAPGRPPRARQPHERLHPVQAGADRRRRRRSSHTTKTRGHGFPTRRGPSTISLTLLEALHRRWVILLESHDELGLRAARWCIRTGVRSATTGCCSSTRGTAGTTRRTSPRCGSEKDGRSQELGARS